MLKKKIEYECYKHEFDRDIAGFIIVEENAVIKP
jgi:hypothetical protein